MHLTNLASTQLVVWRMLAIYNQAPASAFKKVQLNPDLMYQPGSRYSANKIADLWKEMERRIKDPCFGLTAATCWHPSNFGTLGYAMLVSKSLRITLERLIRFIRVVSDDFSGELHEDKEAGTLVITITGRDKSSYSHAREDASLAWLMSILRMNFQHDFAPVSANFIHSSPECAEKYSEFFKSPVTFDSSVSSLALSLEVVDHILPSGNKELATFNDQLMTKYLATLDKEDLPIRVRKSIVEHLPSGDATIDNIASELCYNSRTFQRLLQQEGTTFVALLNESRMELAKQYVQDKNVGFTELAFLLGFSELSSFSRSFKRWTGKSPSQYRKAVGLILGTSRSFGNHNHIARSAG